MQGHSIREDALACHEWTLGHVGSSLMDAFSTILWRNYQKKMWRAGGSTIVGFWVCKDTLLEEMPLPVTSGLWDMWAPRLWTPLV